jgi:adenosylmethionine-8-amino-7-oxononanoate aminotransferase
VQKKVSVLFQLEYSYLAHPVFCALALIKLLITSDGTHI